MTTLEYQLETLGRAESPDPQPLLDAVVRLNAQKVVIYQALDAWAQPVWRAACTPQPQDCGPLP